MVNLIVNIEGMSCKHCIKAVEEALKECKGVEHCDVKLGSAAVKGKVTKEAVKNAIENVGFDVIDISEK